MGKPFFKKNLFPFLAAILASSILFSAPAEESEEMLEIPLKTETIVTESKKEVLPEESNAVQKSVIVQMFIETKEDEKTEEVATTLEAEPAKVEENQEKQVAAESTIKKSEKPKKEKKEKTETKQLIYCTASKKIIPVGQFLLKDGIITAIMHPSPLSRIFFTSNASAGYYLVSANGKSVVKAAITATSIEATGQDGAKVTLLVSDAESMMFILEGKGFKLNEKVKLVSMSHDEKIEEEVTATSDGQLFAVLAPTVVGKGGGICRTQIVRDDETLKFKFPWGSNALTKSEMAQRETAKKEVAKKSD